MIITNFSMIIPVWVVHQVCLIKHVVYILDMYSKKLRSCTYIFQISFQQSAIFVKGLILDVWQASKYASNMSWCTFDFIKYISRQNNLRQSLTTMKKLFDMVAQMLQTQSLFTVCGPSKSYLYSVLFYLYSMLS